MARDEETQKLALLGTFVDNRRRSDETASDDGDSEDEERRPDAAPFFRHR